MSFLFGGQLSTDQLVLQFVHIFKVSFPVWAGIKINSRTKEEMKLELIPAKIRHRTMKMYTNCKTNPSVDKRPQKRKVMHTISANF